VKAPARPIRDDHTVSAVEPPRADEVANLAGLVDRLVRDDLADLLLGSSCAGCARPGRALCRRCSRALDVPAVRTAPEPAPDGLPPLWTVTTYDGVARSALLAHKERGRTSLAGPLGAALAASLEAALSQAGQSQAGQSQAGQSQAGQSQASQPVGPSERRARVPLVVAVPSTRASVRARGHDPLLRIARAAVRSLRGYGWSVVLCPALMLTRTVADQSGLDAAARRANLAGAFQVRRRLADRLAGRTVVLVDDVVTTGATLVECADALRRAGAAPAAGAVVAATPRRTR
jgi:predicted amidophosphoribosyltransferase